MIDIFDKVSLIEYDKVEEKMIFKLSWIKEGKVRVQENCKQETSSRAEGKDKARY